jgi:hypothetical protein
MAQLRRHFGYSAELPLQYRGSVFVGLESDRLGTKSSVGLYGETLLIVYLTRKVPRSPALEPSDLVELTYRNRESLSPRTLHKIILGSNGD